MVNRFECEEIPAYYDENYGCGMEVLRFDSRFPNTKYIPLMQELRSLIARVPVVCPGEESIGFFGSPVFRPEMAGLPAVA